MKTTTADTLQVLCSPWGTPARIPIPHLLYDGLECSPVPAAGDYALQKQSYMAVLTSLHAAKLYWWTAKKD